MNYKEYLKRFNHTPLTIKPTKYSTQIALENFVREQLFKIKRTKKYTVKKDSSQP